MTLLSRILIAIGVLLVLLLWRRWRLRRFVIWEYSIVTIPSEPDCCMLMPKLTEEQRRELLNRWQQAYCEPGETKILREGTGQQ